MFSLILFAQATIAQAPAATPFPANENSRIVCRTQMGTGSRLDSYRICLPKREWQRLWDESRATTRNIQDNKSSRPQDFGR